MTDQIQAHLVDDFSRDLLRGAYRVLADSENPVRLHMFATTFRELFNHTLHALSPDANVRRCIWFTQNDDNAGLTRRQRVTYAAQGGLPEAYVTEELKLDMGAMCDGVVSAIEALNRLTHVRPSTLVTGEKDISSHADAIIEAFSSFLLGIEECRSGVATAVEGNLDDDIYFSFESECSSQIADLASHQSIEDLYVEDVRVTRIDDAVIHYTVNATVTVGLQWGSNSDIRNDMGAEGEEVFPVQLKFQAPVTDPNDVEPDQENPVVIDTSSWRDGYYDDEEEVERST